MRVLNPWKVITYALTTPTENIDLAVLNSTNNADIAAYTTIGIGVVLCLLCVEGLIAACLHSKVMIYTVSGI